MVDVIQVLGEVGGLSYVSQQQARVHDSGEGNLQSNGKERNKEKTIQLMPHLMINPGRVLLSSQTIAKCYRGITAVQSHFSFMVGAVSLSVPLWMTEKSVPGRRTWPLILHIFHPTSKIS